MRGAGVVEKGREPPGLIRRSAAGDLEAMGEVYQRTHVAVRRFLRGARASLDAHTVEDALQETYLRLFRGLSKVDPERPLLPWVLGIARLVALEAGRTERPGGDGDAERGTREEAVPRQVARDEERGIVAEALAALPAEQRSVIVLRHVSGLSMKELAQCLGCSAPTARAHLAAAGHLLAGELRRRGVLPGRDGR